MGRAHSSPSSQSSMSDAPKSSFSTCSSPIWAVSPKSHFLCMYSSIDICTLGHLGGVGYPHGQSYFDMKARVYLSESTSKGISARGLLR
eukprot:7410818-Pyramimonas_sp.AAC.1